MEVLKVNSFLTCYDSTQKMSAFFMFKVDTLSKVTPANVAKDKPTDTAVNEAYANTSPHLLVTVTPCDKDGNILGLGKVTGFFIDGSETIESQWQTPFENSNPEHKLPTFMAMLQSGQLVESMASIFGTPSDGSMSGELAQKAEELIGKTSLTKVNTQQIFLSTQSVRMSLSVFFIAINNAYSEVESQIARLKMWALPQHLSDKSIIQNVAENGMSIANLFPSDIPSFVAISVHGKTYAPFIIENLSNPIKAPIDKDGNRLSVTLEMSVMSRSAWDSRDVAKLYGKQIQKVD